MLYDRVYFATATTGTGTITAGAAESGFRTMATAASGSAIPNGTEVEYAITDSTAWETGTGVVNSSGTTLTRVLSQSSTNALLNLSGSAKVFITRIAARDGSVAAGGTGATTLTAGYLLKGNGTSAVTASVAYDDGASIGVGTATPSQKLTVYNGTSRTIIRAASDLNFSGAYLGTATASNRGAALELVNHIDSTNSSSWRIASSQDLFGGTLDLVFSQAASAATYAGLSYTERLRITDAGKLTNAGIIKSSTGGFEFPDATTQTTAFTTADKTKVDSQLTAVKYDATGANIGPTIANYFTTTISLEASSIYEIEAHAYFNKGTAGTVVWTWAFSSAPTVAQSTWDAGPITGFTTTLVNGTQLFGHAVQEASTTLAHAASGSLTTAVRHSFRFKVQVRTNAATTIQLRATSSSGNITPQAGSYMRANKIV